MDIVFGLWADGGAAPDHGGAGIGSLGAPVVGPNGLLDLLETVYGLSEPPSAFVVRIAAWQAALAATNTPSRFWFRSFNVDAWSTARALLGWRDMLVEAGWTSPNYWPTGRLADLAAAEEAATNLPAGNTDRIVRLTSEIGPDITQTIRRVRLIDARELHSCGWRRLLDRLEANGVTIEEIGVAPAAPADSALGRLQRWITGDGTYGVTADSTLTLATASSGPLASELMGQWIEAVAAENTSLVLVAQEGDTQLLDHGLGSAGQPRAGRSRRSPHRGTLQLLLLGFKIAWQPFDAHALMELLLFARSPIAKRAAWRLAAALEAAPGQGSDEWLRAWADIETAELVAAESSADRAKAAKRLSRWRAWVEPTMCDPIAGMAVAEAVAICDRTIAWAVARYAADQDPLYLATATLAGDVRNALIALGRQQLPRTLIDRMIGQALDEGHDNPAADAEAAPWRTVAHPGAVWRPADRLLWWNFSQTQEGNARSPWTRAERDVLAAAGCPLDDPTLAGQALSAAWERAILNTRSHLLLVSAGLEAHDEGFRHPLAHRISPALEGSANLVRLEDALVQGAQPLAGQMLARVVLLPADLPTARVAWTTPRGFFDRVAAGSESATSFENLLSCQLMWALRHVAHVRVGRARSIPDQNRLLGNLAHALARDIFAPGLPPTPAEAASRTTELLPAAIDRIAAPLRHPALAGELAFAEWRLPAAIAELARILVANGLSVEATELQVSGEFEEALSVRGSIDLVARDAEEIPVIVDLKWTRSPSSRLDELRFGKAVQLATYGAILAGDRPYRAGYFLLNQRQFATPATSGLIGRPVDGTRSLPETWTAVLGSWRRWHNHAAGGVILALGVEGAEALAPSDLALVREVHCERCDYATLCRVRRQQ
jgi:ATP-dependent helicase/nuclease subunit B